MSETTIKRLSEWSNKLGIPVESLEAEHAAVFVQLQKIYPDKSKDFWDERARHNLAVKYAAQLRPHAVALTHVLFAAGEKVDYNARTVDYAIAMFKKDPHKAVMEGLVDPNSTLDNVIVLDTRPELVEGRRNPRFGKPLLPFFQKSVVGVAKKYGTPIKKLMIGTMRGEKADLEVPLHKCMVSRWNIRKEDETLMICTSSTATEFGAASDPEFADWNEDKSVGLLDAAPLKISALELEDYYEEHKGDPVVMAIVEGDLINKEKEATSVGSFRCEFGDVEKDIEALPATMFVSKTLWPTVQPLGLGSRLIVVASLNLGVDLATGERTRVLMTPLAVFVKYLVKPEESLLAFEEAKA